MYVINQTKGIGKVLEVTESKVVVYFEEVDEEKTLLKSFVTIYNTIEEAEKALNPAVDYDEVIATINKEKSEQSERFVALRRGEELREDSVKELMKHI